MMTDTDLNNSVLKDWPSLNGTLTSLTLFELQRAYELELIGQRREAMLTRLLKRICRVERQIRLDELEAELRTDRQARKRRIALSKRRHMEEIRERRVWGERKEA